MSQFKLFTHLSAALLLVGLISVKTPALAVSLQSALHMPTPIVQADNDECGDSDGDGACDTHDSDD